MFGLCIFLFRNIFRVNSPINKPSIENFQKGRGGSAKKCTELELELKAKTSVIFCEDMRVKEKIFTLLQKIADISQSPKELYNSKIHWLKVNFGLTYKIRLNFESVHNIVLYSIL